MRAASPAGDESNAAVSVTGRWCDNAGVRLHYLDGGDSPSRRTTSLLVVPGWPEAAEEFRWLAERLPDRRVVIADVRGRGPSDAPSRGYTFEDHVRDLEAVVAGAALAPAIVVGFSRGSSYALGYALAHRNDVRGLVIGDYLAQHVRLPPAYAEQHARMVVRGVRATERVAPHVAARLQAESEDVPMWDRLRELQCPVLLVRGGRPGAIIDDERQGRYRAALPAIHVAKLDDAGHDLWSRDPNAYLAALRPFLEVCDRAATARP